MQNPRRSRDLSQEKLALMADIDRGYVGKIENAHYSVLRFGQKPSDSNE